MFELNNI